MPPCVGDEAQQQGNPPKHEYAPHPEFVSPQSQPFWQDFRSRRKDDVQARHLCDASEDGVQSGNRVVKLAQARGYFRDDLLPERRKHKEADKREIEEHHRRLTPRVETEPFFSRKDRTGE